MLKTQLFFLLYKNMPNVLIKERHNWFSLMGGKFVSHKFPILMNSRCFVTNFKRLSIIVNFVCSLKSTLGVQDYISDKKLGFTVVQVRYLLRNTAGFRGIYKVFKFSLGFPQIHWVINRKYLSNTFFYQVKCECDECFLTLQNPCKN